MSFSSVLEPAGLNRTESHYLLKKVVTSVVPNVNTPLFLLLKKKTPKKPIY